MKFKHIRVFKAIMETGTVTAASKRLHVSQPTLSQTLQAFEDSLGFKLFSRVKGRLLPTTEATLFLEEINRIYKGMEYLDDYAKNLQEYQSRLLEIGVYPAFLGSWFSQMFALFIDAHPNATVTINDFDSAKVLNYTRSQQINLGISSLPLDDPTVDCSLLFERTVKCIVPNTHPLSQKEIIRPSDLHEQPFISLSDLDSSKSLIDNFFEKEGVKPKTIMQIRLASSACYMVEKGLGIALIDAFSAEENNHLSYTIKPFECDIVFPCYLLRPISGRLSLLADVFIEHLKDNLRNLETQGIISIN